MNERINRLEVQCWEPTQYGPAWFNSTKFAELIVKECLGACSRANEIRHFVPPTREQVVLSCMHEIKEHFGVEE